jgi:hypothetical protein
MTINREMAEKLQGIPSKITDPKKIEQWAMLPKAAIDVLKGHYVDDAGNDLLEKHNAQTLLVLLHWQKAFDRESAQDIGQNSQVAEFTSRNGFRTFDGTLESIPGQNDGIIAKVPDKHTSTMPFPDDLGLKLIGCAPIDGKQNQWEILFSHGQIVRGNTDGYGPIILTSSDYDLPPVYRTGLLFRVVDPSQTTDGMTRALSLFSASMQNPNNFGLPMVELSIPGFGMYGAPANLEVILNKDNVQKLK